MNPTTDPSPAPGPRDQGIEASLRQAIPPELAGMVRTIGVADGVARIIVEAGSLGRAAAAQVQRELEQALARVPGVAEVRVALMATRAERRIIAIGSGKGGVGKSTLTANLAVSLARMGHKVGVVDADVYGPSQPVLLGTKGARARAEGKTLIPLESRHGVRLLSMGHLIEPGKAIAWRGPMVGQALAQLIEADWGETSLLLVDLPPGTGDVQLTMLQRFKPAGALIVSTPQDLALIDAARAIDLFRQAAVPLIGLVENMAGYACPRCGEISNPFGLGGAEAAAGEMGVPFLGRVPLDIAIRLASDAGEPPAAHGDGGSMAGTPDGQAFAAIARGLAAWLDRSA